MPRLILAFWGSKKSWEKASVRNSDVYTYYASSTQALTNYDISCGVFRATRNTIRFFYFEHSRD